MNRCHQTYLCLECFLVLVLVLGSCKDIGSEPPAVPYSTLALTVEDVSCTEAWLKLSTSAGPCSVLVQRDGLNIESLYLTTKDSTLVDEGLLPKRTYSYQAFKIYPIGAIDSTQKLQATTMDTTSHNFTWQIDTLGDGNSSVLHDVAIVNDTMVLAVGEIYLKDSSGQLDPFLYNLAVWNGRNWSVQRLTYQGYPAPMTFVFAVGTADIWFGIGYLLHWDGVAYREVEVPQFTGVGSNRMWASTKGELYVVGDAGTIAYSRDNGVTWQKILSSTVLPLHDIFGVGNYAAGTVQILSVAAMKYQNQGCALLDIGGNTASALSTAGLPWSLSGIWFIPNRRYYVVGAGIYHRRSLSDSSSWVGFPPGAVTNCYTHCVHGQAPNDAVAAGAFGEVVHFNGMTWRNYYSEVGLPSGNYYSVKIRGDKVFAVGESNARAIVLRGAR